MAVTAKQQSNAKIPIESDVDPKLLAALEKSVLGKEQAPTSAAQTPGQTQWQAQRDTLGPPFDSERVTIAQCRQIRKDPMIAFALHYRKVPIARAEWFMEARDKTGINRQVAAFMDAAVRRIYARYIFQRTLALDFGYQAIAKRYVMANPGGVYFDPTDQTVKPVWDEGNVLPKIWKTPVALRPELVSPMFDPKTEEFAGISYSMPTQTASTRKQVGGGGSAQGTLEIDIYHALWATNGKDAEHGSIYGYPLTGHARDYWWAYKFLFGLSNRAYERLAIPPIIAYHPEGTTVVDNTTGARRNNWEIALEMAERLRANAVGAVPSTMAEAGIGETSGTQRAWDFKFLDTPTEALTVFDARFNYLNVMKLRSVWVPELAFTGGESGRTGGNLSEQMQEVFTQSQQLLMEEIIDEINQFMIPQILWLNFPEFVNAGGTCRMKSRGFRADDMDLYKQILQLFGQSDPELLAQIDTAELLRRVGLPLLSPEEYQAAREQQAQQVSQVPNVPGVTIANPNVAPGSTNGGSVPEPNAPGSSVAAGFADIGYDYVYMQPQEHIDLELAETDDFLASLPNSKHYEDKTIRALAVQLRRLWSSHWRRLYPQFAKHLHSVAKVEFQDDDVNYYLTAEGVFFADTGKPVNISKAKAIVAARKLIASFGVDSKTLKELASKSAVIMRKMMMRQIRLDSLDASVEPDFDEGIIDSFLVDQTDRLIKLTHKTFSSEIQDHLVNELQAGKSTTEIADGITGRFETFPQSKAERIARSETRDAVNAATLITGEGSSIRYVKAEDGEEFDPDCKKRNGKLYTVKEAWKQLRKEHPYGTLGFRLMPRANFSISYVETMPDGHEDKLAWFDDTSSTAIISRELNGEEIDDYLMRLSDTLVGNGNGRH